MSSVVEKTHRAISRDSISPWIIVLLATACGMTAANLYYAQPIAGLIGAAVGLSREAYGLIVTMTQVGYSMGLLLIVPLGDLIENRRLILTLLGITALALLGVALSSSPLPTLAAAWLIGIGVAAVQVLVPYAAHLTPPAMHGRVVGNVMSGLMLGVMCARPVSSFLAQFFSWHTIFFASSGWMVVLACVLARALPERRPTLKARYLDLLGSMGRLVRTTPILRRRALYQAALFASFSLFWTTTPLLLAGPIFKLSQGSIALVALAGIAGVVGPAISGRIADRGWGRQATAYAMLAVAAAFLITRIAEPGSPLSVAALIAAAVVLDYGVTTNMIVGQRAIFALGAEFRSRLNSLYMTTFFIGGALGSALGGWSYARSGWTVTSWIGFALPVAAFLYFLTELRQPARG